jgi:hypothetical protein
VGAGEHPDVDADRALFADGTDLAFLQDAEELGLQGGVQLADLIEEQRAQVGLAEEPGPGALRPGGGALAVAEELGLGEMGVSAAQLKRTNGCPARGELSTSAEVDAWDPRAGWSGRPSRPSCMTLTTSCSTEKSLLTNGRLCLWRAGSSSCFDAAVASVRHGLNRATKMPSLTGPWPKSTGFPLSRPAI